MQNFNDLWYYAAVVRHGGFSSAARHLNVAKSMLSRRVRRLEDELGVRLLERASHKIEVTEVGRQFYQRCEAAILEMEAAEEIATSMSAEPRGTITASCLPGLCAEVVGQTIPLFLEAYPKVRIHLIVSTRRYDLVNDHIDIAIHSGLGGPMEADLIVKQIGELPISLVASSEFAERNGLPASPAELADFPTIGFANFANEEPWKLMGPDGAECSIEVHPCVTSNDPHVLLGVASGGCGITLLPDFIVLSKIRSGQLVRVLPEWHGSHRALNMTFLSRRNMLPAVRAFIDFTHARLLRTFRECYHELKQERDGGLHQPKTGVEAMTTRSTVKASCDPTESLCPAPPPYLLGPE
ncbi:MAG: LysR family transcriptional regulator [Rhodospirillales bacterium]|nr:LysR family transcriptional regulator [Rhodospirillales bacterium]